MHLARYNNNQSNPNTIREHNKSIKLPPSAKRTYSCHNANPV